MENKPDIIDVEVVEPASRIVRCPKCSSRNRIRYDSGGAECRCGNCHHPLEKPARVSCEEKNPLVRPLTLLGLGIGGAIIVVWLVKILGLQPTAWLNESVPIAYPVKTPSRASVRSLPNGTIFRQFYSTGNGQLTVENGTDRAAVIKLVRNSTVPYAACAFFVRANDTFKLPAVPNGRYWVVYALGEDWDAATSRFIRHQTCGKFDTLLDFTSYESGYYSDFSLTLHKVVNGNAITHTISEAEFYGY